MPGGDRKEQAAVIRVARIDLLSVPPAGGSSSGSWRSGFLGSLDPDGCHHLVNLGAATRGALHLRVLVMFRERLVLGEGLGALAALKFVVWHG
jgi:hypothetical protein